MGTNKLLLYIIFRIISIIILNLNWIPTRTYINTVRAKEHINEMKSAPIEKIKNNLNLFDFHRNQHFLKTWHDNDTNT